MIEIKNIFKSFGSSEVLIDISAKFDWARVVSRSCLLYTSDAADE